MATTTIPRDPALLAQEATGGFLTVEQSPHGTLTIRRADRGVLYTERGWTCTAIGTTLRGKPRATALLEEVTRALLTMSQRGEVDAVTEPTEALTRFCAVHHLLGR